METGNEAEDLTKTPTPSTRRSSSRLSSARSVDSSTSQTTPAVKPESASTSTSSKSTAKGRGKKSRTQKDKASKNLNPDFSSSAATEEGKTKKKAPAEVPANSSRPGPLDTKLRASGRTADWDDFLSVGYNLNFIPPVTNFKHAPLADVWNELAVPGLKVEIPNTFVRCGLPVYWIATIRHFSGYKALVEYECFNVQPPHASWMSFCSDVPKPLGYCNKNRILLHPPHVVRFTYPNFIEKGREAVRNSNTVSDTHGKLIRYHNKRAQKYPLHTMVEAMDRDKSWRMRVAKVTGLIGTRIHVTYEVPPRKDDPGFWFDVNSDYVRPLGWSGLVGHDIFDSPVPTAEKKISPEHFPSYPPELELCEGQFLEARHPMRPFQICAAEVERVLKHGYFVALFRNTTTETETHKGVFFTFHVTSPFVFPCGFCCENDIKLILPYGQDPDTFKWEEYLTKTNRDAAPLRMIPEKNGHKFTVGMKMEVCGILDPTYLGPATVEKVRKHLIYLTLDGWPRSLSTDIANDTEFWTHGESCDIYPIGYAEMVGHNFQGRVLPNKFKTEDLVKK